MKLDGIDAKFSNNDLNEYDAHNQPPKAEIKEKIEDLIDALPKDNLDPELVDSLKEGGLTIDQLLLILMSINPNAINIASFGGDQISELMQTLALNSTKTVADAKMQFDVSQDESLTFRNDLNSNLAKQAQVQAQQGVQSATGAQLADQLRAEMAKSQAQEFGTKIQVNGNMVSLPGAAGVLMTEQIGVILARGDLNFVDSARSFAVESGYSEAQSQGFSQDQGHGQNGDNQQDAQQQEEQERNANAVFYFDAES